MGIHLFEIYRSANIGIFSRTNDACCLVPKGLASTKCAKISNLLRSKTIPVSIAGSRLIGPLVAMNNKGVLVSRLAEDAEVEELRSMTGLTVGKLNSRFTSVGNLISANDSGAIISDVFSDESANAIESVLQVKVRKMRIGAYVQVGSLISVTNGGGIVHPIVNEEELEILRGTLEVNPEPATINGGVPFVSSGFIGNKSGILIGSLTRGGELLIIGRAFAP